MTKITKPGPSLPDSRTARRPPALARRRVLVLGVSVAALAGCKEEEKTPPAFVPAAARFAQADDRGFTPTREFGPGSVRAAGELAPLLDLVGGIAVDDIDDDGADDILVLGGDEGAQLFVNRDGEFVEQAREFGFTELPLFSTGPLFADVDDDGDPDLLVAELSSGRIEVWLNQDGEHFERTTTNLDTQQFAPALGTAIGDIDRDGDLDVFVARWAVGDTHDPTAGVLWLNDGEGDFEDRSDALPELNEGSECTRSLWGVLSPGFADVVGATLYEDGDREGLIDPGLDRFPELVIARHPGPNQLFINTTPQTGELSFELFRFDENDRLPADQASPPDWTGDLSDDEQTRRNRLELNWDAVQAGALSSLVDDVDRNADRAPVWVLLGANRLATPPDCAAPQPLPWLVSEEEASDDATESPNVEGATNETEDAADSDPGVALDGGVPLDSASDTMDASLPGTPSGPSDGDTSTDFSEDASVPLLTQLDAGYTHLTVRFVPSREFDDFMVSEQGWFSWRVDAPGDDSTPTNDAGVDGGADAGADADADTNAGKGHSGAPQPPEPLARRYLPILSPTPNLVQNACLADFNNDSLNDVLLVTGTDQGGGARALLKQRITDPPHFVDVAQSAGIADEGKGRWVSCFDYDRDGDVDVFLMNADGGMLYENQLHVVDEDGEIGAMADNTHFFGVRVDPSQDMAVMASTRVTVGWFDANGGFWRRSQTVDLNAGLGSQRSRSLHFGVRDATAIRSLLIEWPDDTTPTLFEDLPVNEIYRVRRTASD